MIWALAMFLSFSGLLLLGAVRSRNRVRHRIAELQTQLANREKESNARQGWLSELFEQAAREQRSSTTPQADWRRLTGDRTR